MKIALINDTHFGVKNSSEIFLSYQEKFFSDVFFPYCVKNGITKIIHLGDFYEHRKYVGIKTLNRTREFFIEVLRKHGMTMDIIPGNHDVFYKNTNTLNALEESLFHFSDVVSLYMDPTVVDYDGLPIALLPWIAPDRQSESIDFIKSANATILAAHLELQGFEMMKGAPVMSHGFSADLFSRYEMVLTGHYHTKSTKGNVHYLGTQYELTWADCNDAKYFHILDTSTRLIEQVRNPICLFHKIIYTDNPKQKIPDVKGCFVKVIVTAKKDQHSFDHFIDRLQKKDPFELKTVEMYEDFSGNAISDDNISLADTGTLLNTYVDAIETDLDKDRLKNQLYELYIEAQNSDAL
jgi:DNA repair exonuclease SbcCD nuclease subunit